MSGFYVVSLAMTILGFAVVAKVAGWPSEFERKSTLTRAIRGGVGGTAMGLGALVLFTLASSPNELLDAWSLTWAIKVLVLCALPMFILLTAGTYVQFLIWERNRPKWDRRLRELVNRPPKGKDGQEEESHEGH